MDNKYKVYKYTNNINGKVYIGQTCQSLENRAQFGGQHYKPCVAFYRAIQKYGWDNFSVIILKDGLTLDEANYWETYYIQEYHSWVDDPQSNGYNLTTGGNNKKLSVSTKNKIRQKRLGKKMPEGFSEFISQQNMGGKNGRARPIRCINTGEEFDCAKAAADWCGVDKSGICKAAKTGKCAGRHPQTKELLRWEYITELTK